MAKNLLGNFTKFISFGALGDWDELIKFWGHQFKVMPVNVTVRGQHQTTKQYGLAFWLSHLQANR